MDSRLPVSSPGTVFGPYLIVRLLGTGAFGAVYEALRRPVGKRVAIKLLHPDMAQNPEMSARFVREAQAAAQLAHPHIVDVFDVGVEGGVPFMAMEYLEGETLTARLRREKALAVTTAVDLMLPIISAVGAVHAAGIIHRDLKPGNLMLAAPRPGVVHPKLLDFGIAKVQDHGDEDGLTRTRAVLGTPQYMSPEQVRESRNIDARSDQFSLGVILYECLAGRKLFDGDSVFEVLHQVVYAPIVPPARLRGDIPVGVDRAVMRALERDPAQRFPSVTDLGRALLPFASEVTRNTWSDEFDGSPYEATRVARAPTAPTVPTLPIASVLTNVPTELWLPAGTVTMTTQEVPAPPREEPRRARWPLITAALSLVGLLALGASALAPDTNTVSTLRDTPQRPAATYRVTVRVEPPTAALTLDDLPAATGAGAWEVPRDGRTHTLRASAPSYRTQALTFRDAPPPERLVLERDLQVIASPPSSAVGAPRAPAAAPDSPRPPRTSAPRRPSQRRYPPPSFGAPSAPTPSAGSQGVGII